MIKVTLKEFMVDSQRYQVRLEYEKEVSNLEGLKESFLKRLGNVSADSNSSRKELGKIKPIVKEYNNIHDIVLNINKLRRWNIKIDMY